MSRVIGLLLLVAVIAVGAYVGCGPRVEVAKDAIIKRLDNALGELNVKRKKIELKQTELQGKLDELKANYYRAGARLDLMKEKKKNSEEAIAKIKGQIQQVQGLITQIKEKESTDANAKITLNEKEYTAKDIQEVAESVAAEFKRAQAAQTSLDTSYTALEGSVKFLKAQVDNSNKLMTELSQKINEIDSKKIAVDAVKESTSLAGNNESISDSLAAMSKEIEDLGIDVEAALRIETDKMTELSTTSSKVDEILSAPTDLNSTGEMLDNLLKGS